MISIEKCRELLEDETLTDQQVTDSRDSLYRIAELSLDDYFERLKLPKTLINKDLIVFS